MFLAWKCLYGLRRTYQSTDRQRDTAHRTYRRHCGATGNHDNHQTDSVRSVLEDVEEMWSKDKTANTMDE